MTVERAAYGYVSLPLRHPADAEVTWRRQLAEFASLNGVHMAGIFVDHRHDHPYGFAALRALLRRTGAQVVVIPDLEHVAHITTVSTFGRAGLGRFLGAAVLLSSVDETVTRGTHRF